jgi:hypothetical protein
LPRDDTVRRVRGVGCSDQNGPHSEEGQVVRAYAGVTAWSGSPRPIALKDPTTRAEGNQHRHLEEAGREAGRADRGRSDEDGKPDLTDTK